MTVVDRIRRALADLEAARADLLDLAARQSQQQAREDLRRGAGHVGEVARAVRARLRAVEAEEPQYRPVGRRAGEGPGAAGGAPREGRPHA